MKNLMKHLALITFLLVLSFDKLASQNLSSRSNNSIYICADGTPNVWGYNGSGQFGTGTSGTISYTPIATSGFPSGTIITDVSAGSGFSLFLKNDSTLWACGNSDFGQTSYTVAPTTPLEVNGHTGIKAIGTGFYHSFFIKNDNTVWAMGRNDKGQLGNGVMTGIGQNPTPVQTNITNVKSVTGGFFHSIFLKNDGTVWYCGRTSTNVSTPTQFSGLSGIVSIKAGQYFSLFLKNDGTVWVSGENQYGQFGNGSNSTTNTNTPIQIPGLTGIVSIAAGDAFSLFVKNDGTVWACGKNDKGQLGDGTLVDKNTPVQVSGISNAIDVAAGYSHAVYKKNDNTIWACGYNLLGQLGDGTNIDRSAPVQVVGLCQTVTSLKDLAESRSVTLLPNPATAFFNLKFNSNDKGFCEIDVINSMGKILRSMSFTVSSDTSDPIPVYDLPPGIYYVKIKVGEKSSVRKLIKI